MGRESAGTPSGGNDAAELQRRLAELEERLRDWENLRDTSGYGFVEFGLDGRFSYANPAAERIIGRPAADIVGRHFREIILEKYWPRDALNDETGSKTPGAVTASQ